MAAAVLLEKAEISESATAWGDAIAWLAVAASAEWKRSHGTLQ